MKTLTVLARKGGTGKSTLSMCLAVAASLRGYSVVVADVDPQASAACGLRLRQKPGLQVIETSGAKIHQVKFAAESQGVNLLVIDTPGAADDNALHAVHAADLCLIVTRPNYFDLVSAVNSATTVRQLAKAGLVVLNQAPPRREGAELAVVRKAREALLFTKLPLAATTIRSRASFASAVSRGCSPEELTPSSTAAHEVSCLWAEVSQELGLSEGPVLSERVPTR